MRKQLAAALCEQFEEGARSMSWSPSLRMTTREWL